MLARLFSAFGYSVVVVVPRLIAADTPSWPAPRAMPVLPLHTVPNGPPIPSTPPVESPHPPAVPLWPDGAPGSAARRVETEQISYRQEADIVFPVIFNIHQPSITPFLPAADRATGAAVIIAPGGGNMFLTIDREGYDLARWLAARGVAAFVLKYRLARDTANLASGSPQPYTVEAQSLADAKRAVRLVRARAAEWHVQPDRVGVLGFSAGGNLALLTAMHHDAGDPAAADPVERQSSRPDFFAPIYTGGFDRFKADISKEATPPAFLLCAYDDSMPEQMAGFLTALHQAGVDAELHIFNQGGHGWGVRADRTYSVGNWPTLFLGWLKDRGLLKKE
jgi:endo-1,4-beta-xylanase